MRCNPLTGLPLCALASSFLIFLVTACQSAPPTPPPPRPQAVVIAPNLQSAAGIGVVSGTIAEFLNPTTRAAYIKHNQATFSHLDGTPYTEAELDKVLPTKPAEFTPEQLRAAGMR